MKPSDSDHSLRPVSYIILGMLATAGPMTSYELEHNARISAEPRKLEEAGLVDVESEEGGRRRRVYSITEDGLRALRGWLQRPADAAQTRDPALLQLFFADADPAIVGPLARRKVAELESRLEFLERDDLGGDRPHHRMVLAWGRAQTRSNLEFWRSIAEEAE